MFSRSFYVVAGVLSFFMRLNTIPLCIQTTFCVLFHLGCFHVAAVVGNVGLNMGIQIPLQDPALCAFGYLPRHQISRLYNHFVFNFWRYQCIISPAAVPFYIPETVCKSSSFSLSFAMLVIFCFFLKVAIIMGMKSLSFIQ